MKRLKSWSRKVRSAREEKGVEAQVKTEFGRIRVPVLCATLDTPHLIFGLPAYC